MRFFVVGDPGRRAEGSGAGRDAFDGPGGRWRVRLRLRAGVAHSLAFSNVPYIVVFLSVSFFAKVFLSLFELQYCCFFWIIQYY